MLSTLSTSLSCLIFPPLNLKASNAFVCEPYHIESKEYDQICTRVLVFKSKRSLDAHSRAADHDASHAAHSLCASCAAQKTSRAVTLHISLASLRPVLSCAWLRPPVLCSHPLVRDQRNWSAALRLATKAQVGARGRWERSGEEPISNHAAAADTEAADPS